MIVGLNLKGENNRHRMGIVETDDYQVAMQVVKDHYGARGIERILVLIPGGKDVQKSK